MQHTSCTEDRIHHALERCLHRLSQSSSADTWSAGLCMNRWSLEELVNRDPENFLILLQQILKKTREVQEQCEYILVAPLALMFFSTALQTPYFPPHCDLLREACEVYHSFLTWPEPYCSVCRDLLTFIHQELKAPGISYHRLVREEQGLATDNQQSKTITVLLMNPSDIPPEFLAVSEQLSNVRHSQKDAYIILIKHAYQSAFGARYPLDCMQKVLESKKVEELSSIFSDITDILETAVSVEDIDKAREHLLEDLERLREKIGLPAPNSKKSEGMLQTLSLPIARCHTYHWDKDNFDILNEIFQAECDLAEAQPQPDEGEDDEEEEEDVEEEEVAVNGCVDHRASTFSTVSILSTASKDSMLSNNSFSSISSSSSGPSRLSVASGMDSDFCEDTEEESSTDKTPKARARLGKRISMLFKSKSSNSLNRAKSLGNTEAKDYVTIRSKRSNSLPQQVHLQSPENMFLRNVCYRRRPILSCDEDTKTTTLRVVVFGADQITGKVARAYSNLRLQESRCPRLTRLFKLQFFFIPVKRNSSSPAVGVSSPGSLSDSPGRGSMAVDPSLPCLEDSTNDIAQYLGMLDPWYKRNMLSLLNLPVEVLCQQTSKTEPDVSSSTRERLPILADMVLYYCRHAARPVLVQLYQAELMLAGGMKRTEVFIHSLELGHTAGTRAVKASGPVCKRFGIDGDREAVPLTLEIVYNKVSVSGRNQWSKVNKICTSVNLTKACKKPEELDSKMECLQLTMTEVLKRQNSKSKKGYNQQLNTTQVKVDKVQVSGACNTTFAVCLDQDERKIFQSVTRCEISVCYKPESGMHWRIRKALSSQPLCPEFCSLLCLPISTFSGAHS
uniref:Phosphoinositide 3-kinase regulatory subunit 5 n=1 Tax=Lepisosteus oculatus TaxID=7918 RepID=W5N6T7_LEPOC|nr:PREDICTED: phosphoinositide 3-kinase regulatory subunit 5 [Lepisosteus oculatus]XP_015212007.1 PREDICTED: phosphoinositide 3-kinase regulatory subunit 5 [Lepisosteus oculatus]